MLALNQEAVAGRLTVSGGKLLKKGVTRHNQKYKTLSSVDFQACNTEVWKESKTSKESKLQLWLAYTICGVLTGCCAMIIEILVSSLQNFKWSKT